MVFKEQEQLGMIKKIDNLDEFMSDNPECKFLAHMPVMKPDRESTKCRIVYLSNLAGRDLDKPVTLNNNQCMYAGPCLNRKISTSVMQLRFDRYVLCFDLVKAFMQIALMKKINQSYVSYGTEIQLLEIFL